MMCHAWSLRPAFWCPSKNSLQVSRFFVSLQVLQWNRTLPAHAGDTRLLPGKHLILRFRAKVAFRTWRPSAAN